MGLAQILLPCLFSDQQAMALDLGGESEKILLVTPQIVCHPIDADSPLDNLDKKTLEYLFFGL